MVHQYIEEQNITERYLMRKLSTEERTRFEEHLIDCPECLGRLETTEDLRSSLKSLTVQEAVRHARRNPSYC
jgi:anti-sigma factor RsiW